MTDLFDLAATTHRFESRYLDRLVGPLPEHADRYRDASPVTHAARDPRAGARAPGRRRQGRAARAGGALVDACAPRAARSSTTCTRARATAAPRSPRSPTARPDRRVPHAMGGATDEQPRRAAVTEYEYQGPKRGADRAVLLAHGAGADMHAAALVAVADALADGEIPSLRFNFPYRTAGRSAPDRPPVLEAAAREAAAELARRAKLPPDRLVLGGRSMGGRICSLVAGDDDDPAPGARPRAARIRCTRRASPRSCASSTSRRSGAGAVRERHPRRVCGAGRADQGGARR